MGSDPVREALARLVAAVGGGEGLDLPPAGPEASEVQAIVRVLTEASPARLGCAALDLAALCSTGDKPNPTGALAALKFAHEMHLLVRASIPT